MSVGRPKGSTGAQATARREAMVQAAARVFAARGFDGATTRLLAQEAGVNIGTIAYHFGDKQGLYLAVLDHLYGQLIAMPLPELEGLDSPERVRAVMVHLFRFVLTRRDVVRVLLRHVMEHGRLPEPVRNKWILPTLRKVESLESALQAGPLRERRLALLSLNHLLARYAVTDPVDLDPLIDGEDALRAVEEHLGDVAVQLLL